MSRIGQMFLETAYKKLEDISGIISFLYIAMVMESSLFLRKTITLYTVQRQTFFFLNVSSSYRKRIHVSFSSIGSI